MRAFDLKDDADGNPTALALHSGLLDLQVGEGLRFNCELFGKAVALGLPPFVVRGAEQRADLACRAPERQLL